MGASRVSQLARIWGALDLRRQLLVILATAGAFAAVFFGARMAATPDMALLYAGLDPASAGEVIGSLEQRNIPYEVRGSAIYVPRATRDQSRLTLASEGLPSSGAAGYELLDGLSGFGTTSQMFDAAYWRAKEGELARTIVASPEIRAARVHIATPPRQPFLNNAVRTASVTVTSANGSLDPSQARAIRFLVASAVADLPAEQVTVIDAAGGVILEAGEGGGMATLERSLDQRTIALKENVERLLAARVGPGRAVVEVMVDADMDSQTISERVIDPTSRVAISSDAEEQTESEQSQGGSGVTVASNLPDGDATGGDSTAQRNTSQSRERLNFEVSETRRERVIQPGQIRKISVAVLVDGIREVADDGTVSWQPRPQEELDALRTLVESAIGFDAARGDVVTMQSLEFPASGEGGTLVEAPAVSSLLERIMPLIQTVVLGVVALALGLFVVRPILTQQPALASIDAEEAPTGQIIDASEESFPAPDPQPAALPSAASGSKIDNLRSVISERATESTEVLKSWIEDGETKTGAA